MIDIEQVHAVLLADGWHEITPGTFVIDALEYRFAGERLPHQNRMLGFECHAYGAEHYLSGPINSVLAVRLAA